MVVEEELEGEVAMVVVEFVMEEVIMVVEVAVV